MYKIILTGLLLTLFLPQGLIIAQDCLKTSYESAGVDTNARNSDLGYSSCTDATCCCSLGITNLFEEITQDITENRVNPAVDNLIEALKNQRKASDIKIEELVHLKYVNAIYSFYDKDGAAMKTKKLKMPDKDDDGCEDEIKFRALTTEDKNRKGVYREGLLKEMLSMLHALEKSNQMIAEKNILRIVK